MRKPITIALLCALLLGLAPEGFGQRKNPRIASGKNLRNTILTMLRTAKEEKSAAMNCDASGLLKSIPRNKLVASKEDLAKEIGRVMDSIIDPKKKSSWAGRIDAMLHFLKAKKMVDYVYKVEGKDIGSLPPDKAKAIKDYYYRLKRVFKTGVDLKAVKFKHKECNITSVTNLRPLKWTRGYKKHDFWLTIDWAITTKVTIECPCTAKNKHKVKSATYKYTSKTSGPLRFSDFQIYDGKIVEVFMFGLRFGKVVEPKFSRTNLQCCPDDGSFISPDEDINHENTFIDTGLGVSFAKDEETEMIGSAGILFNVATLGNNPFYLGPKATVNTTSLSGNEIKTTKVLIGPTAEYQIPIGANKTRILVGVNSGYSFGNIDAFGFKQTTSGFTVNAYSGVEIGLGPDIALGVLLHLFEYNNTTFKAEEGDLETTVSNSTFITDRAAITIGLRIDLNKK